ncbi:glycine zipper 2TM domain-containing protein [Sphingomonas cannabina]|uniref:glycine zipper 2TM domain-containing protein n=1 Tax=Sphingomonas cannabina TaxID=2899123 RepID=UPI001F32027D|nr:glycine zipper 2TM domain-containing protein [Sphingomonas cannabina]UIJ47381.1 glycine zipper 2TM domain-containing protein [Sphingomonas cannabina]
MIHAALLAATAAAGTALATPAAAQTAAEQQRFDQAQERFDREYQAYRDAVDRYVAARQRDGGYPPPSDGYRRAPDPYADDRDEGGYDPARYYRPGTEERVLRPEDRVYAGEDGRYYCKRSDGTTGLIVGGAAGGILGNVIDGGHSRTVGTLLGGAIGALAGRSIDQQQSQVRCR